MKSSKNGHSLVVVDASVLSDGWTEFPWLPHNKPTHGCFSCGSCLMYAACSVGPNQTLSDSDPGGPRVKSDFDMLWFFLPLVLLLSVTCARGCVCSHRCRRFGLRCLLATLWSRRKSRLKSRKWLIFTRTSNSYLPKYLVTSQYCVCVLLSTEVWNWLRTDLNYKESLTVCEIIRAGHRRFKI